MNFGVRRKTRYIFGTYFTVRTSFDMFAGYTREIRLLQTPFYLIEFTQLSFLTQPCLFMIYLFPDKYIRSQKHGNVVDVKDCVAAKNVME